MNTFTARVMTWNVRFPNPKDEGDLWDDRRALGVETIRQCSPDMIGVQEAYRSQLEYLTAELGNYACIGRHRRQRHRKPRYDDEHCAILVRSDRFMVESSGTFWYSDTPDEPGSRTWWPDDHPRIVTWARLRHLATGSVVSHHNTHMTLGDDELRTKSARLLLERMAVHGAWGAVRSTPEHGTTGPECTALVVTGDFNSRPGSPTYRLLTGADPMADGEVSELSDAWELAADRIGPAATFHGFTGEPKHPDARIDWILVAGATEVHRIETVTHSADGKYPSDHFPVVAEVELAAEAGC
jgi:endonuclease/exonuclease/phosphatase family metal-dependent hydrolase